MERLDAHAFCVEALEEALGKYGQPEIFNSEEGSQFTSVAFTAALLNRGVQISMDGRGAWRDNVFVERLWRSIKYEEAYLHAYESVSEAKAGIALHRLLQLSPAAFFARQEYARRVLLRDAA